MRRLARIIVLALGMAFVPAMMGLAQLPAFPFPPGMERPPGPERASSPMPPPQSETPERVMEGGWGLTVRRDPFWPVGHVPSKPEPVLSSEVSGSVPVKAPGPEAVKPVDWGLARARLDLRGVSSMGRDKVTGKIRFVALIAGKLAEEGDIVSVVLEGQVYRWRVVSISASGVSLVKLDVHAE